MTSIAFSLRDAAAADADQLVVLYLRSRVAAMPWLVSPHGEAATQWWMEHVVLHEQHVRVAHDGDLLLGFTAVNGAWLEQLYVHPDHQGRGVGRIRSGTPSR
ncbi:MAG: GNAT family N-acetyltransferase [Actinobacteria bacterium]|nr:GNAT family N-acetyltransferase [Actinomycetota bacterium]